MAKKVTVAIAYNMQVIVDDTWQATEGNIKQLCAEVAEAVYCDVKHVTYIAEDSELLKAKGGIDIDLE